MKNNLIKKSVLIILLATFSLAGFAQTTPAPTADVLKATYAKAASEHKNVILIFHASWCGWCKKMEASINDPQCQKMFDDNYVVVYVDVLEHKGKEALENPGSLDLLKSYNAEKSGLPFWLVLDASGKTLATCEMPADDATAVTPADNVGCPSSEKETTFFSGVLKATSKLNDDQLAIIKTRFLKNQPVSANAN